VVSKVKQSVKISENLLPIVMKLESENTGLEGPKNGDKNLVI
jgi:hypothetical protein